MKGKTPSLPTILFLILALTLLFAGLTMLFEVLHGYEAMVYRLAEEEQLRSFLQGAAVKLTLGGGLVAAGLCVGIILFLHLIRRTARIRREAEALRRKNEAMEALNRQTQQLAHHQRLETIGTLTSSIAHEFNNLLTPIMGYSLMALEKLPPEDELYDDLLEIYNSSRKAKTIISRLSDLSRKNSDSTFHQVSPDDLVRKTLDVASPAKPENVEVVRNLNCWDQRITANEIQLSQLLLNLILNAFHAMEDRGGVLTVDTSFDEKHIRIRVSDTGCGIPKENLPKIFEPFFTTKEAGKGTGLGLAIAAQVVEDHKGKIKVDSTAGERTTFTVSLPRTKETE